MSLESSRLFFTEFRLDDFASFETLHTDERVRQFLGGPVTSEVVNSRFLEYLDFKNSNYLWAVRLEPDNNLIGIVVLDSHHNGVDTEISYGFLPQFWGNGYATEAVQRIITYSMSELGLSRVIAETQTANLSSIRLLEKIGMVREQTLVRFDAEQAIYSTR